MLKYVLIYIFLLFSSLKSIGQTTLDLITDPLYRVGTIKKL